MGLFEKKYCDICGEKIGVFGTRKLEDGKMCSKCAAKLSPWFEERRHSTLEDIKGQLEYREENKEAVSNFHTSRTMGRYTKVLLDEDAQKFMVAKTKKIQEENPDVVDFSQVTGCDLDVRESSSEITRQVGNEWKSYNPPRYEYSYDFMFTIHVNHPYFDDMKFKLNDFSVQTGEYRPGTMVSLGAGGFQAGIMGGNPDYNEYVALGNEIKEALMSARQAIRNENAERSKPKKAVRCPYCGATTVPNEKGCCEYCGGAI